MNNDTKQIRCRKFTSFYPDLTPVINNLSQYSSQQGVYTVVYMFGLNFLPSDTTVLNVGNYKDVPISYLGSFNLSFVVPSGLSKGEHEVQLATISTTPLFPIYLFSNKVTYIIT
jgi:hypothetical protein